MSHPTAALSELRDLVAAAAAREDSRRAFLRRAVMAAAALGPLGALACGDGADAGLGGDAGELGEDDPAAVCRPTPRDQLGPYYRANPPERTLIAPPNEPGT